MTTHAIAITPHLNGCNAMHAASVKMILGDLEPWWGRMVTLRQAG